mmetsp:Transcript_83460/g.244694  ORF Transcript_83460/g.244694 Transcript_83460/m.244694 type:complete len:235 (-) Transcript_83460:60-764(-)
MQRAPERLEDSRLQLLGAVRHGEVAVGEEGAVAPGRPQESGQAGQERVQGADAAGSVVVGGVVEEELRHRGVRCQLAPRPRGLVAHVLLHLLHDGAVGGVLHAVELRRQHEPRIAVRGVLHLLHDLAQHDAHAPASGRPAPREVRRRQRLRSDLAVQPAADRAAIVVQDLASLLVEAVRLGCAPPECVGAVRAADRSWWRVEARYRPPLQSLARRPAPDVVRDGGLKDVVIEAA